MIKVLVVDDHPIIRQGLKQILAETKDIIAVAEARNGDEVFAKVRDNNPDVILLDISMPGKSWHDIIRELKVERPEIAILLLSRHLEEPYVSQALKLGASGYLTKSSLVDELLSAIRKVSEGGKYISLDLIESMASHLEKDAGPEKLLHKALSRNEFKIMCLIASGKTIKQISLELSLSPSTIRTYRSRIMRKMGLASNVELIRYGLKYGLVA